MILPTEATARKAVPLFSGCLKYFPRALAAVSELSRVGNEQHNPGKPLFWDRSKSGDELDALGRHLLEAGTVDSDGQLHSVKVAWRALANLEKELERRESDAKGYARRMGEDEIATVLAKAEINPEPGLYTVHPDGSCTFQPTHPIGPRRAYDINGRQISPTT